MRFAWEEYKKWKGKNERDPKFEKYIVGVYDKSIGWDAKDSGNNYPWCAAFLNWCLIQAGVNYVKSPRSQEIRLDKKMKKLKEPLYGSILVLTQNKNSSKGHVTFLIGETKDKNYYVGLGGNQDSQLKISIFSKGKGKSLFSNGFYWPSNYPIEESDKLTIDDIKNREEFKEPDSTRQVKQKIKK